MKANRILLEKKFARIISRFAEREGISREDALRRFYRSDLIELMKEGTTELHCCGVEYLVDELMLEIQYKEECRKAHDASLLSRLAAYQAALGKILGKGSCKN